MKALLNICSGLPKYKWHSAVKEKCHWRLAPYSYCGRGWAFLVYLLVVLIVVGSPASAEVKLPSLFGDNLVLQQGKKVAVWGTADPGEYVTVTLGDHIANGTANRAGQWQLELGPLKAGGPWEMTVAGTNKVTVHNVAVGEVWVDSGQSNMEFPVAPRPAEDYPTGVPNYQQEIASAHYPMIRMFTVKRRVARLAQRDAEGHWEVASPDTVGQFSAVPYFFGRELHNLLHVPVGIINSAWSATTAEAWANPAVLAHLPDSRPLLDHTSQQVAAYPQLFERYLHQLVDWENAAQKAEVEGMPAPQAPEIPFDPRSNPQRPSGLYNAMIAPLIPYTMAGVIWYQGESNANQGLGYEYRKLFPALIQDWRSAWGAGDFPFLFVQLANVDAKYIRSRLGNSGTYAELREAQLLTLSLPNTAMAVTIDIGDPYNLDPADKQDVAHRLALAAEALVYGRKVVYSGPIYESMSIEGSSVRLHFKHVDGGLVAKGGSLRAFEIAGQDRKFVPATAEITGDTVVVSSAARNVLHATAVRYGWASNPACNLYNKAGLPASPFRTDNWPEARRNAQREGGS
jgi:sialate O-acetylesterase